MPASSCDGRGASTRPPRRTPAGKGTKKNVRNTQRRRRRARYCRRRPREFIRGEGDACVVPISELLDELSDKFGDRFRVSSDMHKLLDLIVTLWDDPHIDQPQRGWIESAWNEKGFEHDLPASGLKSMLLSHCQIPPATETR